MTSPELSLVLEKATVLLNGNEFSILRRILADYEAAEINVDTFADSLLHLIRDQEKVLTNLCVQGLPANKFGIADFKIFPHIYYLNILLQMYGEIGLMVGKISAK